MLDQFRVAPYEAPAHQRLPSGHRFTGRLLVVAVRELGEPGRGAVPEVGVEGAESREPGRAGAAQRAAVIARYQVDDGAVVTEESRVRLAEYGGGPNQVAVLEVVVVVVVAAELGRHRDQSAPRLVVGEEPAVVFSAVGKPVQKLRSQPVQRCLPLWDGRGGLGDLGVRLDLWVRDHLNKSSPNLSRPRKS